MSSFDTTREQWELYHREERDKVKEAAEKGDPEAMEATAYFDLKRGKKMDKYLLVMKWDYEYDKESTWFNEANGEERYEIAVGAAYPLPKEDKIKVEIRSVEPDGDGIKVKVYVDHHTVYVVSGGAPVIAHADNSYSVCGDSVHESWCLHFSIEEK